LRPCVRRAGRAPGPGRAGPVRDLLGGETSLAALSVSIPSLKMPPPVGGGVASDGDVADCLLALQQSSVRPDQGRYFPSDFVFGVVFASARSSTSATSSHSFSHACRSASGSLARPSLPRRPTKLGSARQIRIRSRTSVRALEVFCSSPFAHAARSA